MERTHLLAAMLICIASAPARAQIAEICGNGQDDNGNGLSDEGCYNMISGQCENPLGCGDTGSISPKKGSLRYVLPADIAPRVPWGLGIGFSRFYTSQYQPATGSPAWKSPLGDRWQHNYLTWADKQGTPPSSKIVLHTPQGQDVLAPYSSTTIIGGESWDVYTPQTGFHVEYLRQRVNAPNEFRMRLVSGETLVYNSSGRLTEIWDTLTTNKVTLTYDGNGQLSTVTDAQGHRRLLFTYTSGLLTQLEFQIYNGTAFVTQHTSAYTYTSNTLTTFKVNGSLVQTNFYTSGLLTQIQDAGGTPIVTFDYASANAGQVVRVITPRGAVGFDYASSRTACSGQTVLYFNKGNATSCTVDGDCGSGFLCGGKTTSGATGRCFRAARCLTLSSPSEDVVASVTPLGPPGETCDGACTEVSTVNKLLTSGGGGPLM